MLVVVLYSDRDIRYLESRESIIRIKKPRLGIQLVVTEKAQLFTLSRGYFDISGIH
jgi:hypothetical protein